MRTKQELLNVSAFLVFDKSTDLAEEIWLNEISNDIQARIIRITLMSDITLGIKIQTNSNTAHGESVRMHT